MLPSLRQVSTRCVRGMQAIDRRPPKPDLLWPTGIATRPVARVEMTDFLLVFGIEKSETGEEFNSIGGALPIASRPHGRVRWFWPLLGMTFRMSHHTDNGVANTDEAGCPQ